MERLLMSNVSHSKASGEFHCFAPDGKVENGATLSCVHCQGTWIVQKGSGKIRGYCQNCMGYVCGVNCLDCIPIERRIENIEKGRPENTPGAPMILVPGGIEFVT
jgi:hypothetical protein